MLFVKTAKTTLDYFKRQDVDIKIISGDDPVTVSAIARSLSSFKL